MNIASIIASVTGVKGYLYAAALGLLLAGGLYERAHLINEGEARVQKKDAALKAAATALNTASANLAEIQEINIGHTYEKIITAPAIPDSAGLVCRNTSPAPVQPGTTDGRSETADTAAPRTDDVFNPSGELRTDSRLADAQINGLIDTVQTLIDELNGRTK